MVSALRWIAFAWGCIAIVGMAYVVLRWYPEFANPRRNELGIAFMTFLFYGWPAWLALPVLTIAQWRQLRPSTRLLSLAPVVIAAALYTAVRYLGS